MKPGQKIRTQELAEMLHISRTPIREVLMRLREEHLIDVSPQVGTIVSKINSHLIKEALFMRLILEKEILKHACHSFPQESLLELKKNLALQKELIGENGAEIKFHKLDNTFHYILFHGLQRKNVWMAIARISTHYNRIKLYSEIKKCFL